MTAQSDSLTSIPGSDVPIVFRHGALDEVGARAREFGAKRILLVTDPGIKAAGHLERAMRSLYQTGLPAAVFDGTIANPTSKTVVAAWRVAHRFKPDLLIALGGGSSMDTAKGVNFIYTNGGTIKDYAGTNKATKPMLPVIAIPTTAGTGSEAQGFALISDPETHIKMACGDDKALPKLAILDPDLIATAPRGVAAATGIDAISHAIETAGCTKRTPVSRQLSQQAWHLLDPAFEQLMSPPPTTPSPHLPTIPSRHLPLSSSISNTRSNMLLGAHLAGCAIHNSMLGAAHAAANPLTSRFDIPHGVAIGLMLPHVIRFNASAGVNPYADLLADGEALANRVDQLLDRAGLPRRLGDLAVPPASLPELSTLAIEQWTVRFNPRPLTIGDFLSLYQTAL